MILRTLKKSITDYDKVTVYEKKTKNTFKNLYEGKISEIPKELLGRQVGIIGAKKKKWFDIEVLKESK